MNKVGWQTWLAIVGGVIAVVGQFWGGPGSDQNIYLPLIGGLAAIIAGIGGFTGHESGGASAPAAPVAA